MMEAQAQITGVRSSTVNVRRRLAPVIACLVLGTHGALAADSTTPRAKPKLVRRRLTKHAVSLLLPQALKPTSEQHLAPGATRTTFTHPREGLFLVVDSGPRQLFPATPDALLAVFKEKCQAAAQKRGRAAHVELMDRTQGKVDRLPATRFRLRITTNGRPDPDYFLQIVYALDRAYRFDMAASPQMPADKVQEVLASVKFENVRRTPERLVLVRRSLAKHGISLLLPQGMKPTLERPLGKSGIETAFHYPDRGVVLSVRSLPRAECPPTPRLLLEDVNRQLAAEYKGRARPPTVESTGRTQMQVNGRDATLFSVRMHVDRKTLSEGRILVVYSAKRGYWLEYLLTPASPKGAMEAIFESIKF